MSPKRRQLLTFIAGLFAVIAFFILSSIAVVWANGLRYNPETRRFEPTVVLAVHGVEDEVADVEVLVNGTTVDNTLPFEERGLLPGYYEIIVKKIGYYPWRQTFNLAAGEVGLIEDLQFIAEQPTVTEQPLISITESNFEAGLTLTAGGEILDKGKLVSRFATQPVVARRLDVGYVYQINNELRIFFPKGPQDYLVYKLSSAEPAKISVRPSAWEILLNEGEVTKRIKLTVPTEPEAAPQVTAQ